MEGPPYRRIT